jgi:ribosomal protein L11 methyltransferase
MDYIRYQIQADPQATEILLAFLAELPFDTFREFEDGMEAFIPAGLNSPELEAEVADLARTFAKGYDKTLIPAQNWNAVWESNFKPVLIEGFCGVRADFHPPFDEVEHEIVINPRMAFGTGHHATTHRVMELMQHLPFKGQSVLDYGCGTGILAILAAKMGAVDIDAVDIDPPSHTNTLENAEYNGVGHIHAFLGTLDDVPEKVYDIVLANINRNVILESLKALHKRLRPGGLLISSGYLRKDQALMEQALLDAGFLPSVFAHEGKWVACKAFRRY